MMLLETYMKKNKWELEKASNGLLAMEAFQRRKEGFDVIFMGMIPNQTHFLNRILILDLQMSPCP